MFALQVVEQYTMGHLNCSLSFTSIGLEIFDSHCEAISVRDSCLHLICVQDTVCDDNPFFSVEFPSNFLLSFEWLFEE